MTLLSDRILSENAAILQRMLTHPFVEAMANGTLPAPAYRRYLVYEGAFVETAIAIFAHATIKAPDLEAKRWLIGVQRALADEQMAYFEQSYAELGIDRSIAIPAAVVAFDRGMLRIAETGDFAELITAMFAAEWMYWTWCARVAAMPVADAHRRRWVEMHAGADFAAQARWLKESIDRHAGPDDFRRLSAVFARVTELEIAFHHAPLDRIAEGSGA